MRLSHVAPPFSKRSRKTCWNKTQQKSSHFPGRLRQPEPAGPAARTLRALAGQSQQPRRSRPGDGSRHPFRVGIKDGPRTFKTAARRTDAKRSRVRKPKRGLSWQRTICSGTGVTYGPRRPRPLRPQDRIQLVPSPPLPHPPFGYLPGRSAVCPRTLTVCGGCRPHLEESYRVCSRTATGDAWPSETLASLPLPAGERE